MMTSPKKDWRDPNMTVHVAIMSDDKSYELEVTPDFMSKQAQVSLDYSHPSCPDWRCDPTYNLRRKSVKCR